MEDDPLCGIGALIIDGQRHEGAYYQIIVAPTGRRRRATGSLSMASNLLPAVMAAYVAGHALLELKGGQVVQILLSNMRVPRDPPSLRFETGGPIPGTALGS